MLYLKSSFDSAKVVAHLIDVKPFHKYLQILEKNILDTILENTYCISI